MTDSAKRNEIARMACKAFQPRLVDTPCVYPNCACKGPSEVADYVLSLLRKIALEAAAEATSAAALSAGEQPTAKGGQ
jgi:hypothetical protein